MFPVHYQPMCGGRLLTRRELLRVGGLSLLGLSGLDLARMRSLGAADSSLASRRVHSCVFFFLFGGPSHIDLWDMKPAAPREIRGDFTPTATCVPGMQICEHLPLLGGQMDRICLLRSMAHRMNVHGPAMSELFSGREYFGPPVTDQASREDWPSLSSLVTRFGMGRRGLPAAVVLPWYLQFPGQARRIAGQTGGRMGERYNAFLIQGDLGEADFQMEGLSLPEEVSLQRTRARRSLLTQFEPGTPASGRAESLASGYRAVYDLLEHRAGDVFDLRREPACVRDRYGRTTVGQSLLLARRLVEAGVSLITVNWQDETKIDGANTCWDTHQDNFAKLKNLLCPIMDQAFSAFIADLHQRGMLDTTLVVAVGEFGRTPKLGEFTQSANTRSTGRDHWPHAFTALLAGGGVRGGQIYGATNSTGGYVSANPVTPADLTATIMHHLGIDHTQRYVDEFQHLHNLLSEGTPVTDLG